jgi:hypothetical protein
MLILQNLVIWQKKLHIGQYRLVNILVHTTPAPPAVTAIGAVTKLNPNENITGMLTTRNIGYATASVSVACQF